MRDIIKKSRRVTLKNINSLKMKYFRGVSEELIEEALKRNIKVYHVFREAMIFILKKGKKEIWLNKTLTSIANPIGINIARNKSLAKEFAKKLGYPIAKSEIIRSKKELAESIRKIGYPVVIKPLRGAEGKGVTVNIRNKKTLYNSFLAAKKLDRKVLIEKHIEGFYFRVTYIANGKFAVTRNMPAYVVGDGKLNIRQLINRENYVNIERGKDKRLKKITITDKTKRLLVSEGFNLDSILPKNKKAALCFSGYDGGEYIDETPRVHRDFIRFSRMVSKNLQLPVVGIDFIAKDVSKPLKRSNGVVVEINGTFPAIQFHNRPTAGKPRDLAKHIISFLFSEDK